MGEQTFTFLRVHCGPQCSGHTALQNLVGYTQSVWEPRVCLHTALKGSVTWHTIILKYVAKRCIYEPTLCSFKNLVRKFCTICVYGTFWLKCVVIGARGSRSTCFCQAWCSNSTCFCQARCFNSTCFCGARSSPTRTCAIKTSSLTKTCAIRTSSLKNNTFFAKKCHKRKLCKI